MNRFSLLTAFAIFTGTQSAAHISVEFLEGFPTDRFVFTNLSGCTSGPISFLIELDETPAGLVFDTLPSGSGVERYADFKVLEGADLLVGRPRVADGSTTAAVTLQMLNAGEVFSFSIDVDDTLENGTFGQIRVADDESTGIKVTVFSATGGEHGGVFSDAPELIIPTSFCN